MAWSDQGSVDHGELGGVGDKCPKYGHTAGASIIYARPIIGASESHERLTGHSPDTHRRHTGDNFQTERRGGSFELVRRQRGQIGFES
jgi:hypothetical protein